MSSLGFNLLTEGKVEIFEYLQNGGLIFSTDADPHEKKFCEISGDTFDCNPDFIGEDVFYAKGRMKL